MIAIVDITSSAVLISLHEPQALQQGIQHARIRSNTFMTSFETLPVYKNMRAYESHLDIGIRIAFGGDVFTRPTVIDDTALRGIEQLVDYAPSYILLVSTVLRCLRQEFPGSRLVGFFETSFFTHLPYEEQMYAIPQEFLQDHQLQRRGFNGIFHEYVATHFPEEPCVSIVLDKKTTVCALAHGLPQSISLGCTPLEGIMGRTTCGDVDPGIVLQYMKDSGCSVFALDDMLKNRSGFVGMTGYDLTMDEFVSLWGRDKKVDMAFEVYQNHILKYVGEACAVLGCLSTLVFAGCYVRTMLPLIVALMHKMQFLGISLKDMPLSVDHSFTDITQPGSAIRACVSDMPLRAIMGEYMMSPHAASAC